MKRLFAIAALLAACSHSSSGRTTSTVNGKLDAASFPSAPTAIEAVDETGARVRVDVAAGGAFELVLPRSHVYKLSVALAGGSVPVVFPRAGGKLDTTMRVSTGAANVALGSVRHVPSVPSGGLTALSADVQCDDGNHDDQSDGECVDGKDAKTGAACKDDDASDSPDPTKPMAVPEKQAPDDVGGCDRDGEENDD